MKIGTLAIEIVMTFRFFPFLLRGIALSMTDFDRFKQHGAGKNRPFEPNLWWPSGTNGFDGRPFRAFWTRCKKR
jgi:hypothetical protein